MTTAATPRAGLRGRWQALPAGARTATTTVLKAVVTVGAFYLLLTHEVRIASGEHVSAYRAILDYLPRIDARTFWSWVAVATSVKAVGILASMVRWHLLLVGQDVRFPFRHIAGTFLIGRFIGTFLPSTIGLDGYKLYDAARFSDRTVEAGAATVVEKLLGSVFGIFMTFLVAFPLGYDILGARASLVAAVTIPMALVATSSVLLLLLRPTIVRAILPRLPFANHPRVLGIMDRLIAAATAYSGKTGLVLAAALLSFVVHFTTAAMYYFTALAIGAAHANFWEVTFASSIQIFATVMSPFTIAGEGVREIVQTLLLARTLGTSESIISAALGFWAAEALTLFGGIIYMMRPADYRPAWVDAGGRGSGAGGRAAGD